MSVKTPITTTGVVVCVVFTTRAPAQFGGIDGTLTLKFPQGSAYTGAKPVPMELWIGFEPFTFHAWISYSGAIVTSDLLSEWTMLSSPYLDPPGSSVGTAANGGVSGIAVSQFHFPPSGIFANTANPVLIWKGEWSSNDLTPRFVDVLTVTEEAKGWVNPSHLVTMNIPDPSAQIQVIPAPSSLAFLALAGGLACRRRRARKDGRV